MRRRIIISVGVFFLFLLFCLWARPTEPRYAGKPLNYWAANYIQWLYYGNSGFNPVAATNAILHVGGKAVPYALARIQEQPFVIPKSLQRYAWFATYNKRRESRALDKVEEGLWIFRVLGTNASAALPELTKILREPVVGYRAAKAIALVGGVDSLCAIIANSESNSGAPALNFLMSGFTRFDHGTQGKIVKALVVRYADQKPNSTELKKVISAICHRTVDFERLLKSEPRLLAFVTNALTMSELAALRGRPWPGTSTLNPGY